MAETVYELYRNANVVWVEDELTREVLTILWGPCRLHVAVAGSKSGVGALVAGAPPPLKGRVFGVDDLDFAKSNRGAWRTAEVLHLDVHEAENLVLDAPCMASIARERGANVTAEEFEAAMRDVAFRMVPWMACRATLREIAEGLRFPEDPRVTEVPDLDAAVRYVQSHPAWSQSPATWARWGATPTLRSAIGSWEKLYRDSIGEPSWCDRFSGKEILRALWSDRSLRLDGTPRKISRTSAERDLDVARSIAHRMVEMHRVPEMLIELRDALLTR
jgi:hypothetical protein